MKKLDYRGFAHHILIPLLVVAFVGTFGAWRIFDSYADTPNTNTRFRVGSFNIYHVGNDPDSVWKARLRRSVDVIKSNNIDIVGLQEARSEQQKLIATPAYAGKIYNIWPASPNKNPDSAVLYNKSKFKLIDARQIEIKYNGPRAANLLHLKAKSTGVDFYFINTHDPVNWNATVGQCPKKTDPGRITDKTPNGHCGPDFRKDNAELYLQLADKRYADEPFILVGDFNSNYEHGAGGTLGSRENGLPYCILTSTGSLWNATDALKNKPGQCPSTAGYQGVNRPDNIYIRTTMKALDFGISPAGRDKNGSDVHDTVFSTVVIPRR